jgi:hypothetical protein
VASAHTLVWQPAAVVENVVLTPAIRRIVLRPQHPVTAPPGSHVDVRISIDTTKAALAQRGIELGAELVNDVTALRGDPELAGVVASSAAYLCLMHMQGEPRTMQDDPTYQDVASEVASFLEERLGFAVASGIPEERISLDPGFGFGKTVEQNFELLARLGEIVALGRPVVVGLSRSVAARRLAAATASWMARLMPTPPIGDIAWAESPMQSRPGRYQVLSRSMTTVRSLTSSQSRSSPTRSCRNGAMSTISARKGSRPFRRTSSKPPLGMTKAHCQ